jgi:hypothetical protein
MGKSLLELLGERNASTPEIVKPKPVIPSVFGDVIKKYVGDEIYTREEKNAAQTINFIKNVPRIYGLDAKRILLQRDPHADKVLIKKAAGAVGSLLGPIGARVGNFLADFNPKYPDDFLEGEATELKFSLYSKLISSDYAGGKYYNGGVKNNKSKLGSFLQGNRTPQQIKDNAIAAAKTMIIGAAIAGVKKLLTRKKRREDPSKTLPPPEPFFPSTFVLNSSPNDGELVAFNQLQQRKNRQFPTKFGKELGITSTIVVEAVDGDKRKDELASLDTLYSNHIEKYLRKNNDTDTRELYDNYGYYTSLTINNGDEDSYKRIRKYSKDVLRIFQASKTNPQTGEFIPETWDRYPTIIQFEAANPNWDNLIPDTGLLRFGTQNVSSPQLGGEINLVSSNLDNWLGYNAISGTGSVDYSKYWIKPVRWNGREAKYSDQEPLNRWAMANSQTLNTILDQDYYFASQSYQSQTNSFDKKYNPYLKQKREVLNTSSDASKNITDRIKFNIGEVKLLGTLTGLTDATTPNWSSIKGVGSGFHFYGYDHWEREVSFRIRLYAESESDLKNIWIKANQIKTYTLPIPQNNLGVFGRIIKLQIGDLINEQHGFLTQCEMNVLDESPWEITQGLQKPFIFDMNISYKVVYNEDNFPHYPVQQKDLKAYKIETKPQTAEPVVIGAPPQFGNTETDDQLDSSPLRSTDSTTTVSRERAPGYARMSSNMANGGRELNRAPTDITPKRAPDSLNQKFGLGEVTAN